MIFELRVVRTVDSAQLELRVVRTVDRNAKSCEL